MHVIKLCGLTRKEDIEKANELLPDYVGFVFYEKSSRNLTAQGAKELKSFLDKKIKAVGVFVDAKEEFIEDLFSEGIIDMAQLHGHEDNEYILRLKEKGIPTIKAYKVKKTEDTKAAENCAADYIMFDAGKGDGISFDWDLIKDFERPFFLAGGLHEDNVLEAMKAVSPYAVDVSSGIETDGIKDPDKMERFVRIVRDEKEQSL